MHRGFSRREFAGVLASLSAVPFLPACVSVPPAKRPQASNRINVGFIGYGTMASDNMGNFLHDPRVQITAVCDPVSEMGLYGYNADPERKGGRNVGKRRVEEFYAKQEGKSDYAGCKTYIDFRDMLDNEPLDAVVISTPDHWHAAQAIAAAKKGLHIYGQKPLSLCIEQGRAMADAVKKYGITFQTGSQQRSDNYFRMACEFVRNGRIGKIQKIEVGLPGGFVRYNKTDADYSPDPISVPPWMSDFNLWLGPAPTRPFCTALHTSMTWRNNLDYSGGLVTDWGAHHLDIVQWALGMDDSGPVLFENLKSTMPSRDKTFNIADHYSFEAVYADGTRMFVSDSYPNGIKFYGENGKTIFVTRGKLETNPAELMRAKLGPDEIHLYKSSGHEKNFIDCIYSGQETITPCEVGHRSITIAHIANIGFRLGRDTLRWDPRRERFEKDTEANALRAAPMRSPWNVNV